MKNKKAKSLIISSIICLIVSLLALSPFFVFAQEGQTEKIEYGRKVISNEGVSISAKVIEHCAWKPDSENDGYKICEAIIYGHNKNHYELTVDKPGDGFTTYFNLDKDAIVKNKNYDYYYSNQYEEYFETILNETCFLDYYNESSRNTCFFDCYKSSRNTCFFDCYKSLRDNKEYEKNCSFEIVRKRFYNWLPLEKDIKDTPTNSDEYFAYKVIFEFPQYEKARYDFSINYKKQDSTEIPILLDPDISACGILSTAGATYTQTDNIIPTTDANCIIIFNCIPV